MCTIYLSPIVINIQELNVTNAVLYKKTYYINPPRRKTHFSTIISSLNKTYCLWLYSTTVPTSKNSLNPKPILSTPSSSLYSSPPRLCTWHTAISRITKRKQNTLHLCAIRIKYISKIKKSDIVYKCEIPCLMKMNLCAKNIASQERLEMQIYESKNDITFHVPLCFWFALAFGEKLSVFIFILLLVYKKMDILLDHST